MTDGGCRGGLKPVIPIFVPGVPSTTDAARTVSNERVFQRWDYPLFALLTALNLGAVAAVFAAWFSPATWTHATALFVLITIPFVFGIAMFEARWLLLPLMVRPRHMDPTPGWKVGVATTFVPGWSPSRCSRRPSRALVAMDYPHDTWVLDEGDDEEVKKLCERLGVHYSPGRARLATRPIPGAMRPGRSTGTTTPG